LHFQQVRPCGDIADFLAKGDAPRHRYLPRGIRPGEARPPLPGPEIRNAPTLDPDLASYPRLRPAMLKKTTPAAGLTAAECARRTGLTVRALRVYERAGLLKPARSAKGWRVYRPAEIERLNIVVALKGFGLTLAQIRKSFGASPPALAAVLDMQIKTW